MNSPLLAVRTQFQFMNLSSSYVKCGWVIVVPTTHWVMNIQLASKYKTLGTVAGTLFYKIITKLKVQLWL